MRRPTQKDVADRAGVSRSTVSYVLNGQTGQKIPISAETRQRVLEVIAELEYEPDRHAQSLRRGSTRTIGVLFPTLQNPYFGEIFNGISMEAQAAGYSLHLTASAVNAEQEAQNLAELLRQHVDGFILMFCFHLLPDWAKARMRNTSRPIVELSSLSSEFDHVVNGYEDGTRWLMAHLFELGHRRIGFVYGVAVITQGYDRLLVYRQILKEAGLPVDESLVEPCGPMLEDGYTAARRLLSRPDRPTALLVINDLLAMAVLRAAADLGLRIPADLSVASFDDIPFSTYTVPRLTTISSEPEQNGRDAVQLLLKRLNEPDRTRERIQSVTRLVVRESTGPAPL